MAGRLKVWNAAAGVWDYVSSPGGNRSVGCHVTGATQSLASGVLTAVAFDGEMFDTDALHSTVTNNSRITIPAGLGGKWRFDATLYFDPNATGDRLLLFKKNGATYYEGGRGIGGNAVDAVVLNGDITLDVVAGDYVEVWARQSSGTAISITTTNGSPRLTAVRLDSLAAGTLVANDPIWDAAGDLAVGSGADTAARLAKGANGGMLAMGNGSVIWNAGASFPANKNTNDRFFRTDLGLECYWDGTRWLGPPQTLILPRVTTAATLNDFRSMTIDAGEVYAASCPDWSFLVTEFYAAVYDTSAAPTTSNFWVFVLYADSTAPNLTAKATYSTVRNAWHQATYAGGYNSLPQVVAAGANRLTVTTTHTGTVAVAYVQPFYVTIRRILT